MPELPEVECLTRAIRQAVEGWQVESVKFYRQDLRDKIPVRTFKKLFEGAHLDRIERRSKYMLWFADEQSCGIFHLGMTGNMMLHDTPKPQLKHTHAVFGLREPGGSRQTYIHFVDPRRFGRIDCCQASELDTHKYFADLGVEPLEVRDLARHLFKLSHNKHKPIKNFIMDNKVVVGVGNIYASESLFHSGIHPLQPAGSLELVAFQRLARQIRKTLKAAIKAGGTTFRDFKNPDGDPGYFKISLMVYGRTGEPCRQCQQSILELRLAGRSTFYCEHCQKIP